jgi:hypothetical protein
MVYWLSAVIVLVSVTFFGQAVGSILGLGTFYCQCPDLPTMQKCLLIPSTPRLTQSSTQLHAILTTLHDSTQLHSRNLQKNIKHMT